MKNLILMMLLLVSSACNSTAFEDGISLYKSGSYKEAYALWEPLAKGGDAEAQLNLGIMYSKGVGVIQDDKEAAVWFLKSAELGNGSAQLHLGLMYSKGIGVTKNDEEAGKWYRKAVNNLQ